MSENTVYDSAFDIIPKNSTFFIVWRVEKLQLAAIPRESYGQFFNGDSYIIACGTEYNGSGDSQMESQPISGDVYIHIHFWIGSKSSQDEAGIAAIKTVEMDSYLGGSPIQHRETEGHESKRFLSYFPKGIRVLNGGIATGFKKVDFTIKAALFLVKGKRNPIVKELPEINWLPFNDGDIFILAQGKYIFLWTGKHANNMEKVKAIRIAEDIRAEHSHYCESIVIVDDGEETLDLSAEELKAFEEYLPLKLKCVDKYDPKEDETKFENFERADVVLYRCTENDGAITINKVKNGPLVGSDLDSNDTFIIDNDVDGIWVWVGRKASRQEKASAMKYANKLIEMNEYNPKTRIRKVIEGSEVIEFKSLFKTWIANKPNIGFNKPFVGRVDKVMTIKSNDNKLDNKSVKENQRLSAETQLVDDGKGSKECFYVQNTDLLPLKAEHLGKFYKQNCYIIVYTYDSDQSIIYYWFGSESTPEERLIAESKASELNDNKFDKKSVLVRVMECEEPIHLMLAFNGLMSIYRGKYDPNIDIDNYLLQVKGTTEYNTKLVEVERNASSLNSNCVLILTVPGHTFIWAGNRSIGDKREMAKKVVLKEYELISEGEESEEFWNGLGGKGSYDSTKVDKLIHDFQTGRLFEWRKSKFEEISQFKQTDLDHDDIIILDAFDVLFIWFGSDIKEKYSLKEKVRIGEQFIRRDVRNRSTDLPIYVMTQGCEPTNFTGFFNKWSKNYFNKNESFDELKRELRLKFMQKFPIN